MKCQTEATHSLEGLESGLPYYEPQVQRARHLHYGSTLKYDPLFCRHAEAEIEEPETACIIF